GDVDRARGLARERDGDEAGADAPGQRRDVAGGRIADEAIRVRAPAGEAAEGRDRAGRGVAGVDREPGAGDQVGNVGIRADPRAAVADLAEVVVAPAGEIRAAQAAGVGGAGANRGPVRVLPDGGGDGAGREIEADAELAGVVLAPAAERAALDAAGVRVAGRDRAPAAAARDRGRQDHVAHGRADADLAVASEAPAPEAAVGLDGARVVAARGDLAPDRGRGAGIGDARRQVHAGVEAARADAE